MKQFLCILVALALFNSVFAAQPFANLTFVGGRERKFTTPVPELIPIEEVTDVCVLGTFVLYDSPNFEIDRIQTIFWSYPENEEALCYDYHFLLSSARPVAHMVDTQDPFASLFAVDTYNSDEVVVEAGEGLAYINIPIHSIYMRRTSLLLFNEPNFSGEAFCILDCGASFCEYIYMSDIPGESSFDITQAKSARLGCTVSDGPSAMSRKLGNSGSTRGFKMFTKNQI